MQKKQEVQKTGLHADITKVYSNILEDFDFINLSGKMCWKTQRKAGGLGVLSIKLLLEF